MSKIFLLLILFSLIVSKGPYKKDKDVLILTDKNFGSAILEFKYLVVLFYDPGCPHCQNFLPEYSQIASELKKDNFIFAKIDCTKNPKIETTYEIGAYPTLMLLIGEQRIIFEGKRTLEEIKTWIEEKTRPELHFIKNNKELAKFIQNKICLVYFGNNETSINNIILAERKFETMPLGIVSDPDLIKAESPKDKKDEKKIFTEYINIYKNFDENKNSLKGILSYNNILKFVKAYSFPKVMEFNEKTSPVIFAKRQPALVIFGSRSGADRNPKDFDDSKRLLNYMWPQIRDKIRLFVCDIKDRMGSKMAEYCDIDMSKIPKVFIIEAQNDTPLKYEMTGGINEENIMIFIKQWSKGKLTPYIRSEPLPDNKNKNVIKLVGKNFKKEVLENDKDVLVYFVSPKCSRCKDFEPELEKLAMKLKQNNDKIVIATMDATLNDIEDVQFHYFPTIMLYPGNDKESEPVELKGKKNSVEIIEKFIKKNAFNKIIEPEVNSEL